MKGERDMTKKSILMIVSIILFVAVIIVGVSFAWFVYFRNSLIVVSGDANISVEGWYDQVTSMDDRVFDDENKMAPGMTNEFESMPTSQFIAYKFQITNHSERAAVLSLRISNMFDYIFNGLKAYVDSGGTASLDYLYDMAEKNNGRLAFLFDNIYYEYENTVDHTVSAPVYINDPDEDIYIWKYSRGEMIIGNGGDMMHQYIDKIPIPANGENTVVNLYMSMTNKQLTTSIEAYKRWFVGDENAGIPGTGQEYGASLLGYTWAQLKASQPAKAGYIDAYITKFVSDEIASIISDDISDGGSRLNLSIDYFEFIGENA